MRNIWRKLTGEEPQNSAERVLSRCKQRDSVDCWSSPSGALQMAVFLEQHSDEHGDPVGKRAKVRVAYRTFHPRPVLFTRSVECIGGTVDDYDPAMQLEMMAGRNGARRYRTGIVPNVVNVERGANGAQIDTQIMFAQTNLQLDGNGETCLSVVFPNGEAPECSCC
jgi:hypothetical protein